MPDWNIIGIHHTAINATDFDRSLAFYRDTLGFTVLRQREISGERLASLTNLPEPRARTAMLAAGNNLIELFEYLAPPPRNMVARPCDVGITHVALLVSDIQAAYEGLSAKGVEFNCAPGFVPEGPMKGWTITYFRDPDGISLELMQPPA